LENCTTHLVTIWCDEIDYQCVGGSCDMNTGVDQGYKNKGMCTEAQGDDVC
jgi:hypothetical protein